jgi:hypothetical protein
MSGLAVVRRPVNLQKRFFPMLGHIPAKKGIFVIFYDNSGVMLTFSDNSSFRQAWYACQMVPLVFCFFSLHFRKKRLSLQTFP